MKKLFLNPVYKWTPAMFYEMCNIREGVNKKNISRGPVRKALSLLPRTAKTVFLRTLKIHIFPFQNILHLFLFSKKNQLFGCGLGFIPPPPPFMDRSVNNIFLTPSLKSNVLIWKRKICKWMLNRTIFFWYFNFSISTYNTAVLRKYCYRNCQIKPALSWNGERHNTLSQRKIIQSQLI